MRIITGYAGCLTLELHPQEASLLDNLVSQLIELMQSHSMTDLDPDPLFASLEVGGSDSTPEDPALARLFPDAYKGRSDSSEFRRVTEQGLINRKLEDATTVSAALSLEAPQRASQVGHGVTHQESASASAAHEDELPTQVIITQATMPAWIRSLSALRLAIAARLGLESEEDYELLEQAHGSRSTVMVYDWLGGIIESVLQFESLLTDSPEHIE